MTQFRILHTTEYRFTETVSDCCLELRLRPRTRQDQECSYFQIVSRPLQNERHTTLDAFGNHVDHLSIDGDLQRLLVSAVSTVSTENSGRTEKLPSGSVQVVERSTTSQAEFLQYCEATSLTPRSPAIADYAHIAMSTDKPLLNTVSDLSHRIYTDIAFLPGTSNIDTTATEVLSTRQGVCQDFSHLAIAALRSRGIMARYVSGYLHTAGFRGKEHRMASDRSHAWFEVFDPETGWVGFDPANGRRVDENYITVAWGRDYNDVCPLQGTFQGGGAHSLHVSVDVQQL